MSHPLPEQVERGVCPQCGATMPLRADGTVKPHAQRTRTAERSRRKPCAGSRCLPRQEQP
jgi:hypothetical protein